MKKRKVIFLDIDGVLQRFSAKERFEHDLDQLFRVIWMSMMIF